MHETSSLKTHTLARTTKLGRAKHDLAAHFTVIVRLFK